ncbi:unnamed protein product, partial [Amoebophrya sp. A25]
STTSRSNKSGTTSVKSGNPSQLGSQPGIAIASVGPSFPSDPGTSAPATLNVEATTTGSSCSGQLSGGGPRGGTFSAPTEEDEAAITSPTPKKSRYHAALDRNDMIHLDPLNTHTRANNPRNSIELMRYSYNAKEDTGGPVNLNNVLSSHHYNYMYSTSAGGGTTTTAT